MDIERQIELGLKYKRVTMKANRFLFLFLLCFPTISHAEIYKHVDAQGKVTYSNIPSDHSKRIDLPPIVVVPAVDSHDIEERLAKRRETTKINEQREEIENKISEEEKRLSEIKSEYKDGEPDRLGSERNYQRYLNRVERLKEEISAREKNLDILRNELRNIPEIKSKQP